MFHFQARSVESPRQASLVIDVLRRPRLWIPTEQDYPGHAVWLEKVEAELMTGKKRALIALLGKQPVGAVVYQADPQDKTRLEIRNISISPDAGDRYIGSFLVRSSEIEAKHHDFPEVDHVTVDTKATNTDMLTFLSAHGYERAALADLYGSGRIDAVLGKSLV